MEEKLFRFDFAELGLTVSKVENVIGFNEGEDRDFMKAMIEELLVRSGEIAEIKAQYRILENIRFNNEAKTISIEDHIFNIKRIVSGQIKKSDSVALFLCTAGEEIGRESRKSMQERDLLTGYIYDVIGSEIVEAAADLMQADLEKEVLKKGKKITNRYSPGYCGWDVAEQKNLFQFFPDNHCGIRLTPSALMDPVKSVSGIIGIGENVRSNPYTCGMCEMKDCIYRKAKEKSTSL